MRPIEATKHLPHSPGVYRITSALDGKNYVGSSKDIQVRCRHHIRELNKGTHHGRKLLCAWQKHGVSNFTFHVLELCAESALIEREAWWMDHLQVGTHGYNTYAAEPTGRGYTQSPEHIEKRVAPARGRPLPQSTRDAVAEANKRRVLTPEQREAARVRLARGKAAMSQEEFSHRLSESMKGRVLSQEQRDKISEARTGQSWRDKPGGEERAARVSAALKAIGRSEPASTTLEE